MKTLYVDNFRGFNNTYIPIKDVNFFVGDNSTGKSSIIALLNLLSRQVFWVLQSFNLDAYEFGDYTGIANSNRSNEDFLIGYYESDEETEPKRAGSATLLDFCNVNNMPIIRSVFRMDKRGELRLVYDKRKRLKKYVQPNTIDLSDEYLTGVFNNWLIDIKKQDYKGYGYLRPREFLYEREDSLYYVSRLFPASSKDNVKGFSPYFPAFTPFGVINVTWVGPIRSKPKRMYEGYKLEYSPEGEHIPNLISRILSDKKLSPTFLEFIKSFGVNSKLFDSVEVHKFGKTKTSPFELLVSIDGESRRISDVGYGVSQALPIVVEFIARKPGSWFAIQQPEVHLHPKAQAALGDLIYSQASLEKKKFYIETHSDFLIDRFRIAMSKHQSPSTGSFTSQVLFFQRKDGVCSVQPIAIEENGDYSIDQPSEFREFFINEQFELIRM